MGAVAKKTNTAVSTEIMDEILEYAGEGTAFDSSELQIPFLRVLQQMSPQLNKKKAEYIEGASAGDMYNTVTNQYFDGEEGVLIVPAYQTTKYLCFTPREQGGGFRGEIDRTDPVIQRATRQGAREILPNGDELVKSDQHYCLLVTPDGLYQPVVVDMKSTQLKVSRRWKSMIASQRVPHPKTKAPVAPPVFATMWKLTTVEESNDQGTWANYAIENAGLVNSRELLLEAKTFRDSVAAGDVKAAPEEGTPSSSMNDEEIPF